LSTNDYRTIRAAARDALGQPPVRDDPLFATARRARVGRPALVRTPEGAPAFWLVPLLVEGLACGLAQVSLGGDVARLAILGGAPDDRGNWVDAAFFERPPPDLVAEVAARYGGETLSAPTLSYDCSPARWAWRIEVGGQGAGATSTFITPGAWYARGSAGRASEHE
jgi:hypothetical protein